MNYNRRRLSSLLSLLVVVALTLMACNNQSQPATAPTAAVVDPAGVNSGSAVDPAVPTTAANVAAPTVVVLETVEPETGVQESAEGGAGAGSIGDNAVSTSTLASDVLLITGTELITGVEVLTNVEVITNVVVLQRNLVTTVVTNTDVVTDVTRLTDQALITDSTFVTQTEALATVTQTQGVVGDVNIIQLTSTPTPPPTPTPTIVVAITEVVTDTVRATAVVTQTIVATAVVTDTIDRVVTPTPSVVVTATPRTQASP